MIDEIYKLKYYITLSQSKSGVFYPLFKRDDYNYEFIPEIDKESNISAFIPFFDIDEFVIIEQKSEKIFRKGEPCPLGYIDNFDNIVEIDVEQLKREFFHGDEMTGFSDLPILTRLSISRILNVREIVQLDLIKEFSQKYLKSDTSKKIYLQRHIKDGQDRDWLWSQINESEQRPDADDIYMAGDQEYIIRWLYDNVYSDKWISTVWHLTRTTITDSKLMDMILDISCIFFSEKYSDSFDTLDLREKDIIGRCIEYYIYLGAENQNFSDFMYDIISSGQIFYISDRVKPDIILNFIDIVGRKIYNDLFSIDILLDQLEVESNSKVLANSIVEYCLSNTNIYSIYDEKSIYSGFSRLERLDSLVQSSPRLGLVLSEGNKRRLKIAIKSF